jgi:hypothetical protein
VNLTLRLKLQGDFKPEPKQNADVLKQRGKLGTGNTATLLTGSQIIKMEH